MTYLYRTQTGGGQYPHSEAIGVGEMASEVLQTRIEVRLDVRGGGVGGDRGG